MNIESATNYMIQDIKPVILEVANNILMKSNFKVLEELDYPSYFPMVSNEYKIDVTKGEKTDIGQILNISCSDIYIADDQDKLNDLMRFFEGVIQKYEYEFQLFVIKGYYTKDYVNLMMMERKEGKIHINNNVEESNLLKDNNSA